MAHRVVYTDHLVGLVAAVEAAATRVAGADPDARSAVAERSRRESARFSVRLDGSPLDDATADEVDRAGPPPALRHGPEEAGSGSWARALKLDGMATQDVAAVEYANLLAVFDAEADLASGLFDDPIGTLRDLHRRICAGLVDAEVAGRTRTTEQAIHDGAQGLVIYATPPPDRLPPLLQGLASWLGHGSAGMPTVVVAGVLHERLLEWHPFEAANGRTARAASRLVLRARGLDPHGVAVVERPLAADPAGYYREVAATMRRRGDLGPWLERYAEALALAIQEAAEAVDPRPAPSVPARARAVTADLEPGAAITVSEYAVLAGVARETATADLGALVRAGSLRVEPRTRGLRFRRM